MKNMDKYQKIAMGILIAGVSIAFIYVLVVFIGTGSGGSDSGETSFPFYIFFPSWVAIFVPLMARKKQEAERKEEELRNQLEA